MVWQITGKDGERKQLTFAVQKSQSLKGLAKMRYDKEHTDSLSKYPELKERMQKLSAITERILRGNFRTRADNVTGNRADRNGGRKNFEEF